MKTYESIEHFGNTSIPGMVAKPVIAIMMEVPFGKMPQTIEEFPVLECRHKGDGGIPGREVYEYLPPYIDLPVNHFYTCCPDQDQLEVHRAFWGFLDRESRVEGKAVGVEAGVRPNM